MSLQRWALHGLVVRSDDVPLDARPASWAESEDVLVRLGKPRRVPTEHDQPAGRVLASFESDGARWLTVVTPPDGGERVDVHFHGLATAHIDHGASTVDLVLDPAADPGLASVLLGGTVMSVVLILRGHPVLHASAVVTNQSVNPQVFAFVGASGMGKSTVATLACRDGARLFADDVLRTDVTNERVVAWPGATATRLRPQAADLASQSAPRVVETADGRHSAQLPPVRGKEARTLSALVVPMPDRQIRAVQLEQLSQLDALLTLSTFPRIQGWRDAATAAQAHRHLGQLAQRVPLFIMRVPWGPPFTSGLGSELLESISSAVASA